MTDFNDPDLEFEHRLRDYVNRISARANVIIQDFIGNDYTKVNVEYDPADGGKWSVSAYVKNKTTQIKGAALAPTVDLWIRMFTAQNNIAVLPALLAPPTPVVMGSEDITITAENDDPI